MKILAIQNLYPPEGPGGCGIAAQALLERLCHLGHDVLVLTSTYHCAQAITEGNIWRVLAPYEWAFIPQRRGLILRELGNQRALLRAIKLHKPDVTVVWSLSGLSLSLILRIQELQIPIVYYLHDHWLLHWQHDPWQALWTSRERKGLRTVLSTLLASRAVRSFGNKVAPFGPDLDTKYCLAVSQVRKSEYVSAGILTDSAPVIPNGVDTTIFKPSTQTDRSPNQLKLLFVGNVVEGKGIHVALEALTHLPGVSLSFTIAGPVLDHAYRSNLERLTNRFNIALDVTFLGAVPHERMAELYQEHDALLLPSIVPEGLPLVILEALACGLPVIATNNGGQTELIDHGCTGFLFSPEDSMQLAEYIGRLCNKELRLNMGLRAQEFITKNYDWNTSVKRFEAYLTEAIARQ